MKCSRCRWQNDDEGYFFPLTLKGKKYTLCSACWADLTPLIETKQEDKLIEEIEKGRTSSRG